VVSLILFVNFSFDKIIISIFQISRAVKYVQLLLSDILSCVVYC